MTTLRFGTPKNTALPADLVFNQPAGAVEDATLTLTATLPAPVLSSRLIQLDRLRAVATLPPPVLSARVLYDNAVLRGPAAATVSSWQPGTAGVAIAQQHHQNGLAAVARIAPPWQEAQAQRVAIPSVLQDTLRCRQGRSVPWAPAVPVGTRSAAAHADMLRERLRRSTPWQNATPISDPRQTGWQDRLRTARPDPATGWRSALRLQLRHHAGFDKALHLPTQAPAAWQTARKPPPGRYRYVVPVVPPERCYTPPLGGNVALLFQDARGDGNLVFICHRGTTAPVNTIIVPIRSVYMTINNVNLIRVDGNYTLPVQDGTLSLNLDMDSWTWGFSATLPASALALVEPGMAGDPVLLKAMINGAGYLLLAEGITRNRVFGKSTITVSGRGQSAMLADPYSPIQTFANAIDRTAQQLMVDALTINGVSIGWAIDWRIDDWTVPAGVWNHQGSYMSAVNAIAAAAGAFIQPDPDNKILRVRPRYPAKPWEWAGVTPDIELPSDAITKESIAWSEKPGYNAVYISGASAGGILGHVRRTGTAGDIIAPMIVDSLITDAIAARQRALPVLADTGRGATYALSLPVLAETGVIEPGALIRYVDNGNPTAGVVKGTSVTVAWPSVRQTIEVQTHG